MKCSLKKIGASLLVFITVTTMHASSFSLDSIERWTGSGSCRAALIVDWNDGTRPRALAWGYRFNPGATGLDMWNAITAADPGLTAILANSRPANINYQRPTRDGGILPGTGNHPGIARWTAYTFDHADDGTGTWSYWTSGTQPVYIASNMTLTATSPASRLLVDGAWDAWTLSTKDIPIPPSGYPAAALYYPFATEMVKYTQGGPVTRDWLTGLFFNNPYTTLGRPTVDTTGDNMGGLSTTWSVPVVPVFPAFRADEMVSLGLNGGELILGFDHNVYDNPDNPYGATFIVFGNAFQVIGGGSHWNGGDPALTTVGGSCFVEGGEVYVGQNSNGPWHLVSGGVANANFPGYVDDFAPTLGRVYDPGRPETSLVNGKHLLNGNNPWWGGATDPTIPVDPKIIPAHLGRYDPSDDPDFPPIDPDGMTVADVSKRYRGSAGGTAFSIHDLDLSVDPDNGMKWIRYVRLTSENTWQVPEVDAIADVSPTLPIDLWRNENFHWLEDPALEADDADFEGDGVSNIMKYVQGKNPREYSPPPAPVIPQRARTSDGEEAFVFSFIVNPDNHDIHYSVVRTDFLLAPPAAWTTKGTRIVSDEPVEGFPNSVLRTIEAPMTGERGFMQLRVKYE